MFGMNPCHCTPSDEMWYLQRCDQHLLAWNTCSEGNLLGVVRGFEGFEVWDILCGGVPFQGSFSFLGIGNPSRAVSTCGLALIC